MAEGRLRRILRHASGGGASVNSAGGGIAEESAAARSIVGEIDGQWQQRIDRGIREDGVRSCVCNDKIDRLGAVVGRFRPPERPCSSSTGDLDGSMEVVAREEASDSNGVELKSLVDDVMKMTNSQEAAAEAAASTLSEAGSVSGSLTSSRVRGSDQWPVADDCIFCKIVHGYAPAFKLYEDEFCLCILDINPLCYGHSLLVPKGHFPALDATPPRVAAAMCSVVPLLSNVLMEATSCDSFNMVVNNGQAAGQVVFHTHFHIVPRFSGDGLWTNESVIRKSITMFEDPTQLAHAVRSKLLRSET